MKAKISRYKIFVRDDEYKPLYSPLFILITPISSHTLNLSLLATRSDTITATRLYGDQEGVKSVGEPHSCSANFYVYHARAYVLLIQARW